MDFSIILTLEKIGSLQWNWLAKPFIKRKNAIRKFSFHSKMVYQFCINAADSCSHMNSKKIDDIATKLIPQKKKKQQQQPDENKSANRPIIETIIFLWRARNFSQR